MSTLLLLLFIRTLSSEYRYINSIFFPSCHQLFLECFNRNYNPVERRCKGGKERSVKGCQKTAKSLQANNMHSPGSGDPVEPSKKLLLSLLQLFIFVSNEPYIKLFDACQSRTQAGDGEEWRNGRGKFFWRNSSFNQGGRLGCKTMSLLVSTLFFV